MEVSSGEETDDVQYLPPLKVLGFLARHLTSSSSSREKSPATANTASQTEPPPPKPGALPILPKPKEKDQANNSVNKNYNDDCSVENNNLKSIEDSQESPQKTKYNRRELKRLISTPKKAGRPYSFSLYCNLCGAGFPSPLSLRTHMAGKHSESTFACNLCPQRFFNESSLNKHFVAKHSSSDSKKSRKPPSPSTKPVDDVGDVGQTKNRAKCPHCSKIFATNVGRHTECFVNSDNCYICST